MALVGCMTTWWGAWSYWHHIPDAALGAVAIRTGREDLMLEDVRFVTR